MAIRKLAVKLEEKLGPAIIYDEDVQALAAILMRASASAARRSPAPTTVEEAEKLTRDEARFADEAITLWAVDHDLCPSDYHQLPKPPDLLMTMSRHDPDMTLSGTPWGMSFSAQEDTPLARGIGITIKKYLDENTRPFDYFITKSFARMLVFSNVLGVVCGNTVHYFSHSLAWAIAACLLTSCLAVAALQFFRLRVRFHTTKRDAKRTWWSRHADTVVPQIVARSVAAVVVLIVGILIGRYFKK